MSKSAKKQKARERAAREAATPLPPQAPGTRNPEPGTDLAQAVDEAAFERAAAAARAAGVESTDGDRRAWLYNGDDLSIKYVEAGPTGPRRLMVAAFRQGVVFQVEGDRQLSYRPGGWETAMAKLLPSSG